MSHPLERFLHLASAQANSRGVLPLGCQMTRALYPTRERGTQDRAHSQYLPSPQVGCGTCISLPLPRIQNYLWPPSSLLPSWPHLTSPPFPGSVCGCELTPAFACPAPLVKALQYEKPKGLPSAPRKTMVAATHSGQRGEECSVPYPRSLAVPRFLRAQQQSSRKWIPKASVCLVTYLA